MSNKITNKEILVLMKERGLTVKKCIDVVIKENGIIGVGLISLSNDISNYIRNHKILKKNDTKN